MKQLTLALTTTAAALIAGLFYAWSCAVIPGLARLADREYIAAVQAMNRAILNPVFFVSFLGTALLLPLSTYLHYEPGWPLRFWYLLIATILYGLGVLFLTGLGNVPLNEALDAFRLPDASETEIAARRMQFETTWNRLHYVRTGASILVLVLLILACLQPAGAESPGR